MKIKELLDMDGGQAIEWLIQNQHDYELFSTTPDSCPECNSKDTGASCNSAYCYECQYEERAESTAMAVIKFNHRKGR